MSSSAMEGRRIMVVEDDDAHRAALARHLGRSGFEVMACESAEQALSRFVSFAPEMVISDIRMGGMTGMELLGMLTDRAPGIRVVLITAQDDMQLAVDAMSNGATDFLMKPLDLDQLDEVIAQVLSAGDVPRDEPEVQLPAGTGHLIGRDPQMVAIYKMVGRVAGTNAPVLIRGETGTGKELVARTIHENSPRRKAAFITVNCAALPEQLLESELFGHLKGSFTGASADRRGRFELASDGTILLDEIGDTSAAFQAKLLRVLQEKEFYPVGGEAPRKTNARVIAATHRDLEAMSRSGTFRQDLYFRLRVVELNVPALRDRRSDIPRLARHLAAKAANAVGKPAPTLTDAAMAVLLGHPWPGNVRQLENAVMRAVVLSQDGVLGPDSFELDEGPAMPELPMVGGLENGLVPLAEMERMYVQYVLARTGGHKSRTAEILRVSRGRLDRIIDRHDLAVELD
ncbi:MAG TPA: sigma-54 dependent transcriptional regulator [Longimicrobiales bacterium]|nr:sigma-54 dependent transcriptional regulator [Longimicrobiales bacterium]